MDRDRTAPKPPRKPRQTQIDTALDVLAWLTEQDQIEVDGETRDEISHIRDLLWNL